MKVLVIPDVHLKPGIFRMAAALMKSGAAEQAVCLMDIADDWNQDIAPWLLLLCRENSWNYAWICGVPIRPYG